jgi:uncharacterized protein
MHLVRYTWRPNKYQRNLKDHGVAFEDAVRIFDGPTVEQEDTRFDYGEIRMYAIGLVNGVEITVIYTDIDEDERRIISAWRAEPHERRTYWKTIKSQR